MPKEPTFFHVLRIATHQGQDVWVHVLTTQDWDKVVKSVTKAKTRRYVYGDQLDFVPFYQESWGNIHAQVYADGVWSETQLLSFPFYRKLPGVAA